MIESKYNAKMRELMDQQQVQGNEWQAKVRRLEAELKAAQERIQIEQRGKASEQGNLEKRVSDLQD